MLSVSIEFLETLRYPGKLIKLKIHRETPGTICVKMQCLIVFHMPTEHSLK